MTASNAEPTFDDVDPTSRTVPENSEETNVGAKVTASDSDSGDTLVYLLGSGRRTRAPSRSTRTGQIKTTTGAYDFEAAMKNTYEVIVSVHDGKDVASYDSKWAPPSTPPSR